MVIVTFILFCISAFCMVINFISMLRHHDAKYRVCSLLSLIDCAAFVLTMLAFDSDLSRKEYIFGCLLLLMDIAGLIDVIFFCKKRVQRYYDE